jgi:hypothetical protein
MSDYTCDYCGEMLEYFDNAWTKYGDSYEEEIIDLYECKKCDKMFSKRDRDWDLEEYDI